ncbi:hypothetical protein HU200_057625 [Digitaria exilis]|uniref:glutathione transferase n=1 Tax=Digitaria exilis TaxID=1010633 RepID=A0A835AKR5_9POAL|nr:hypothetical protein HU200_057625 [Digitaria exilis]
MAPVKVFGPVVSPNVARVVLCLEEVGVEYEIVNVEFATGEHKSPEHLQQSRAISRHVLRKYKSSEVNLLGESNLEEAALVDVWLDVEANQYDPAIAPIIYQQILVPMQGGSPNQKLIDDSVEKMKKLLDVYEAQLSKFKYLAGDFVSLADLSHLPYTIYFMATPYASVLDSYPKVKAWFQDLMARPAVQRVADAELPDERAMWPVKVFGSAAFTNVARVLVWLEEVGAEYEIVDVDFHAKEHKGPEHLARNCLPRYRQASFQDGDLMLFPKTPNGADLLRHGDLVGSALVDSLLDVEAMQYEPAVHAVDECLFWVFVQHHVVPVLGGMPDEAAIGESVGKPRKVPISLADLRHFPHTHYLMGMPYVAHQGVVVGPHGPPHSAEVPPPHAGAGRWALASTHRLPHRPISPSPPAAAVPGAVVASAALAPVAAPRRPLV